MPDLPRLKPDPIPAIHPVPEYAATGPLADVYARTREGLGVPWMGVVAMAFAHYPQFYGRLWAALEPVARTEDFRKACATIRSVAEEQAARLGPHSLLPQLVSLGYSPREIDEIRACNEVFSAGNMPYLLMATLARRLLEGHDWHGTGSMTPARTRPIPAPKPVLIEPHHADPTTRALYADIRDTLGLPFVNTDYRAFARWPSYFAPAWQDLKNAVQTSAYDAHVTRVHDRAIALAAGLPNATDLTSPRVRAAAELDAPPDEVVNVVRLFQWLLPGLAVNVAFLRETLHP